VPISNHSGEYLVWFRAERIRTVTWGGNPFKAVVVGNDPTDLSPRRSFAQWRQLVEGTSAPWSAADRTAARRIGESVADIVLQFRSVRMLIAEDQLSQVRQQVRASTQPVVIVDSSGRILLLNESFEALLRTGHPHLEWIEDLAVCFEHTAETRETFGEILRRKSRWRGQLKLRNHLGESTPLLLRADPVASPSGKTLGFVLLFTNLTERRTAETARKKFQEGIVEGRRATASPLEWTTDMDYGHLLSQVLGNAQLAALEITDGRELTEVPTMLEHLRASVTRSARLLEHLIAHANITRMQEEESQQAAALKPSASRDAS
jgi:two-component system, chemotaxis family, sensor kinase Cph1